MANGNADPPSAASDGGITWTATFTPSASTNRRDQPDHFGQRRGVADLAATRAAAPPAPPTSPSIPCVRRRPSSWPTTH
ncbi:hypothetical protein [Pseudomonas fluorescens]|uniref:hypothetical protein n=1 Tax=Pseudomonas fluorescens TaxID=294 RepID=UPI003D69344C